VLTGALGLLTLNLAAALVAHPAFRRQLPLLVAHLALLALVLLVGIGRLTALDARFELTQGVEFDGVLIEANAGPWHGDAAARLARFAMRHDGFEIDYAPGRQRGATRNPVSWRGDDSTPRNAVIGDHRPLVIDGHRIYTSPNKGFAPLLRWLPTRGEAVRGAVHLPSFPMHELRQSREWALPDGREVWVLLQFDENLIDPDKNSAFRLPEAHRLIVRIGSQRAALAPGERLALDGGTLVYEGLRTWMGYRVAYDPTLPWLLAASLLAALSLAWHYARKFFFSEPATRPAHGGAGVAHG
jgi:cytochrome c biogenesis protein